MLLPDSLIHLRAVLGVSCDAAKETARRCLKERDCYADAVHGLLIFCAFLLSTRAEERSLRRDWQGAGARLLIPVRQEWRIGLKEGFRFLMLKQGQFAYSARFC